MKDNYVKFEDKIKSFYSKNSYLEFNETFNLEKIDIFDFYNLVFKRDNVLPFEDKGKENYKDGIYNSICVNIKKSGCQSLIITKDLELLDDFIDEDFVITSPITYIGRNRNSNNARYCYGLAFDIDGVLKHNLIDLLHQMEHKVLPIPNIIVNSGNGVHLYYLFEKPIALFPQIKELLKELKYNLTDFLWNAFTSSLKEKQFQGIFQGFRLPDTKTKFGERVTAFKFVDTPYATIEYLDSFIYPKLKEEQIDTINKAIYRHSKISLAKAKELYPDWYERRIVKKEMKGRWHIKRDLYDWWIRQLKEKPIKEGHRYFCIMALSMYAIKCNISYEELEKDAYSFLEPMESLTKNEDNHFTEEDIQDALKAFKENYVMFPRKDIEKLTGILIPTNKRNGRKQKLHLKIARNIKEILYFENDDNWRNLGGRPKGSGTKENVVLQYRLHNPQATMYRCIKETKLDKKTVKKYWDIFNI